MKRTAPSLRCSASLASILAGLLGLGLITSPAEAQPRRRQPTPAPADEPGPQKADPLVTALAPQPGGLTPDEFARASLRTRPSLRVKQAELRAASAQVTQALVNFFPQVTLTAQYARLSPVRNSLGGGALLGVQNAGTGKVTVGPCPPVPPFASGENCVLDSNGFPAGAASVDFPVLNNNYTLKASIGLPISDYVLRISQGYAAASHGETAKKLEVQAESLQIAADAKIAFYNWVRVKGQVVVAGEAVAQAQAHLEDARRTFEVGVISRADVLRLEAQVAGAEQVLSEANAGIMLVDEQMRIALGAPPDRKLDVGIDVMGAEISAPPPTESLEKLQQEALQKRLEIRALDETVYSLKNVESLTRAGYFPRLDAFAEFEYSNPNQRIFPQRDEFNLTWLAGARATWTLNDIFTTAGASAEASARTAQVEEQKQALRDGLRLEVASAYADMSKAARSIETAERQLAAAEESMRVRTELFRAGRATSVDVVDAEAEVTRARLQQLDARVGALVAKTRLDHALGRDVKDVK